MKALASLELSGISWFSRNVREDSGDKFASVCGGKFKGLVPFKVAAVPWNSKY